MCPWFDIDSMKSHTIKGWCRKSPVHTGLAPRQTDAARTRSIAPAPFCVSSLSSKVNLERFRTAEEDQQGTSERHSNDLIGASNPSNGLDLSLQSSDSSMPVGHVMPAMVLALYLRPESEVKEGGGPSKKRAHG